MNAPADIIPHKLSAALPHTCTLPADAGGMRLDAAMQFVVPGLGLSGLGLRGRRRLWTWCRISVNNKNANPAYKVRGGDIVCIETLLASTDAGTSSACAADTNVEERSAPSADFVKLLASSGDYAAFFKPAGLHTAGIAGSATESLEGMLPALWKIMLHDFAQGQGAEIWPEAPCQYLPMKLQQNKKDAAPFASAKLSIPKLLTRLDRDTSGIVLGAYLPAAAEVFRTLEAKGAVTKVYFAVVMGEVPGTLRLRGRLCTDNRKITRVLEESDQDAARHTIAEPIGGDKIYSLLRVVIHRGARHQIRAHLAHAGFPIVGDDLYSAKDCEGCVCHTPSGFLSSCTPRLYLHHAAVSFSGFSAVCMPLWGLGEKLPPRLLRM